KYAIMGPDIVSTIDKSHQNPQPIRIIRKKDGYYLIAKYLILLLLNYLKIEPIVKRGYKKFNKQKEILMKYQEEQVDVQLHGSCLIFSPIYIKKFDGLFDKTFMYYEEDILFYLCKKNNFK